MSGGSLLATPRRVLIVGADARAHALAWAIGRSGRVERLFVAPGNPGTAGETSTENIAIAATDVEGLARFAQAQVIDLTVVSPEGPLAAGIVDHFRAAGLTIFGPTKAAARLESSKTWARDFMARHDIPRPLFRAARSPAEALDAIRELGGRCVVKADGLSAGKGVIMARDAEQANEAARAMLVDGRLGEAGANVVIEQWMEGPELSVMAITDGSHYRLLPPAQDHKRLGEGDTGPNTGGMGSYAPAPIGDPELLAEVARRIVEPTLAGMAAEGQPFTGCLYCGLMLTADGPKVIEFNSRLGDPETQVQLPLLEGDLAALLLAAATGRLAAAPELSTVEGRSAVCVVLAADGYPNLPRKGTRVHGLGLFHNHPTVRVFHAGTATSAEGYLLTAGGRVLSVVGLGDSLARAREEAYSAIDMDWTSDGPSEPRALAFTGMRLRRDIASTAFAGLT